MRIPSSAPFLLAVAALLAASAARAEVGGPAEAARKVLGGLPAPTDAHAWSVDVDLHVGGKRVGGGTFAVAPETVNGRTLWRTREEIRVGPEAAPQTTSTTRGLVGGDLRLAEEVRERKGPDGTTTTRAVRTDKGLHVTFTKGDTTEEKDVEAAAETLGGGICPSLLFLQQVPAAAAEYEVTIWNGDTRAVEKRHLSVKGLGRMKSDEIGVDVEALWAVGTGGKDAAEVYLDPKDRSFLGFSVVGQGIWATRKGLAAKKETTKSAAATKPAESAKGAGAKFAIGILTGDESAIEASFHWPSLVADAKSKGTEVDEATLRAVVLSNIRASLQQMPVEMATGIVQSALDGGEEKALEDGAVRVRFGPPMEKVVYTAKRFEGAGWLITRMRPPGEEEGK